MCIGKTPPSPSPNPSPEKGKININIPGLLSAFTTAAAYGLSAYGQIQSGKAQSQAALLQSGVDNKNAIIAQENIAFEKEAAYEEKSRLKLLKKQQIALQQAALAGSGISGDINNDITNTLGYYVDLDMGEAKKASELRIRNYQQQSDDFDFNAQQNIKSSKNYYKAGMNSALATAAGGLAATAEKWTKYFGKVNTNPDKGKDKDKKDRL